MPTSNFFVSNVVTIEVRSGPAFRATMDVLDLADELLKLLPEWHSAEREELQARADAAAETIKQALRVQK